MEAVARNTVRPLSSEAMRIVSINPVTADAETSVMETNPLTESSISCTVTFCATTTHFLFALIAATMFFATCPCGFSPSVGGCR